MFTGMSQVVICEITVPGSAMEENSTSVKLPRYSRAATAPELWIPYLMIGVSCVTFLAVHFYCYHKRNRERYLRKRDEKRVKCGLLERRRITTLMVARYQYSLGIGRKENSEENTVSWNNGSEFMNASKGNNHDNLFGDEYIPGSSPLFSPAMQQWDRGGSSFSSETGTPRLTSSQSWPLVSERSPLPSNAHCKTVIEKQPHSDTPTLTVSSDASAHTGVISEPADRLTPRKFPYRYGYSGAHRRNYLTSMLKPPPTTYSNPYYANMSSGGSHFTSPSPLFFKLKPNKRRYDGVQVDDLSEVYKPHEHHVMHDRGEVSSPFYDDDGDVSEPYIMADPNDDGFGYGSRGQSHYHPTVLDASGFAVSEEEAYPFSDFRDDFDGINANPYMVRGGTSAIRGVDRFQGNVDCFIPEPVMSVHNIFNKKNVCQSNHTNISPIVHHQVKTTSGKQAKVSNHYFSSLSSDWASSSTNHRALNHTNSQPKGYQLFPACLDRPLAGGGQVNKDIGHALVEPGKLLLKPFINSRPPYNNNCVTSHGEVNIQMESLSRPSFIPNNRLPCGNTPFPKALPGNEAISSSPTMPTNFNGQTLQKSSGHDFSCPTLESHHSLNSPQNTPSTPDRILTPNLTQNNTPSTPGSCTSPSSPRTPTLRTLNPNLVFPHAKRKTNTSNPE